MRLMRPVRQILMDLFGQVLRERGRQAPTLDDITIERASARFLPRVVAHFLNGQRSSVSVRPADLYPFCERHSSWDLETLRIALLREGRAIYQQMQENHLAEEHALQPEGIRNTMRPTGHAYPESNLRRTLWSWWQRTVPQRMHLLETNREAHKRGRHLLTQNLSPSQRDQYETRGYFEVVGGTTGKRYRIRNGRQMNVEELDKHGRRAGVLCFMPQGGLVVGDVLLAQKLALELFEPEARAVANIMPSRVARFEFPSWDWDP
jgi:hypothetical protein